MNYVVMVILCDRFGQLNTEFGKCVRGSDGRQLSAGDFKQFRRRHQAISRSVEEADRFLSLMQQAVQRCRESVAPVRFACWTSWTTGRTASSETF